MTKTLIDIDDDLLAEAMEVFGTKTKKDTVNHALSDAVRQSRVNAMVERLAQGGLPDLADEDVMASAWR